MALPLAKQAAISEDINALTRLQYLYFSLNSAYISLKNYDSANIYLAAAYKLSEKTNQGKGEIWEAMGQNEMQNKKYNTAISYFKNSEADAIGSNNLDLLSTIYLHYSSYYDLLQQSDSVVYYSKIGRAHV